MDTPVIAEPARSAADAGMRRALIGALVFAAGSLVTMGTYYFVPPGGTYFIGYGIVAIGAWQFLRGLVEWRRAPREDGLPASWADALVPIGVVAVGVVALAYVGINEYQARVESEAWEAWNAAVDEHDRYRDEAATVLEAFIARPDLSQRDVDEARTMADLYDKAAGALESVEPLPAGVEPHRAKLSRLEREYASSWRDFATAVDRRSQTDIRRHLDTAAALDEELARALDEYRAFIDERERALEP